MSDTEYFVDQVLQPYADCFLPLIKCDYKASILAQKINEYLYWLNRIGNSDWIPAALFALKQHGNTPEYVCSFFQKLERLAAYLHICGKNINQRIQRYKTVLVELELKQCDFPIALDLEQSECKEMLGVLVSDIYLLTSPRKKYILLRLDSWISDGGAHYNDKVFTIEHVLPQSVQADSQWEKLWPEIEKRDQWLHKLANLVPLNRRRNAAASNYDFKTKKEKYFQGIKNSSSYALTSQVLNIAEWTEGVVNDRQKQLLQVFVEHWGLSS